MSSQASVARWTGSRFALPLTFTLLLVGFVALLGIVGMTFWLGERARIYFDEAIEARDTRGAAVELRSAVQTAESSQRGFLYTGNEIYLAPYETAKTVAERQLNALVRLLRPYPQSAVAVDRLTTLLKEKTNEMDRTIQLKRDRQDAEVFSVIRTNRGKALMDEANVFLSGIIRAADERLTRGVGEQKANAVWLRTFAVIGAIVIAAMVGGSAQIGLRHTQALRAAHERVRVLNTGLEQRVEERTADLAQANEEIRRFAHVVTHDLRAPLISIVGFSSEIENSVSLLRPLIDRLETAGFSTDEVVQNARTTLIEDLPEAVRYIQSSSSKMDRLINAVLKLSREGQRKIEMECVDLEEVLRAAAAAIQHQLIVAKGEVVIDVRVPPIWTDGLSLEQVIGNLLDNAVKYRSEERPLRIEVHATMTPDDRPLIEITDNGRGIAEKDLERIFELFSRFGKQNQPGEGIGLAYVRTIVRKLGGDITVASVLGEGTTFRVGLPRNLDLSEPRPRET